MRSGGIHVADYHANLIYNAGGGTAAELCKLIVELKSRVRKQFGLQLEEEVQYVGFSAWSLCAPSITRSCTVDCEQDALSVRQVHTLASSPLKRAIVQSYESFGLRKTYSAAILPSRTMMTSSPV